MWIYIPIPTSELPIHDAYPFDLYLTYNKKFILFRGRSLPMNEGVLNQLRDNGVDTIFIQKGDYQKYLKLLYEAEGFKGDNNIGRYLQERFIPVEGSSFKVGSTPGFMIFTVEEAVPTPLVAPDVPGLRNSVFPELPTQYPRLYIFQKDLPAYSEYLNRVWSESASFSPMNAAGGILVRENAKLAAHGLFHRPNLNEAMHATTEAVSNVLDRMLDNPETYYTLLKVSDQDFNTYIHSVNVAVLSMGMGMEMRLSEDEMHWLGLGSMLHDIGKRDLDPDLLVKKGDVTPSEYEVMREHVILGIQFCEKFPGIPPEVSRIVAEHHERLDGSGYPNGLHGEDLGELGQIVALFEIYDALTNRQPYRNAFTPFEALEKMRKFGKAINQELLTIFIKLLGTQKRELPS